MNWVCMCFYGVGKGCILQRPCEYAIVSIACCAALLRGEILTWCVLFCTSSFILLVLYGTTLNFLWGGTYQLDHMTSCKGGVILIISNQYHLKGKVVWLHKITCMLKHLCRGYSHFTLPVYFDQFFLWTLLTPDCWIMERLLPFNNQCLGL